MVKKLAVSFYLFLVFLFCLFVLFGLFIGVGIMKSGLSLGSVLLLNVMLNMVLSVGIYVMIVFRKTENYGEELSKKLLFLNWKGIYGVFLGSVGCFFLIWVRWISMSLLQTDLSLGKFMFSMLFMMVLMVCFYKILGYSVYDLLVGVNLFFWWGLGAYLGVSGWAVVVNFTFFFCVAIYQKISCSRCLFMVRYCVFFLPIFSFFIGLTLSCMLGSLPISILSGLCFGLSEIYSVVLCVGFSEMWEIKFDYLYMESGAPSAGKGGGGSFNDFSGSSDPGGSKKGAFLAAVSKVKEVGDSISSSPSSSKDESFSDMFELQGDVSYGPGHSSALDDGLKHPDKIEDLDISEIKANETVSDFSESSESGVEGTVVIDSSKDCSTFSKGSGSNIMDKTLSMSNVSNLLFGSNPQDSGVGSPVTLSSESEDDLVNPDSTRDLGSGSPPRKILKLE